MHYITFCSVIETALRTVDIVGGIAGNVRSRSVYALMNMQSESPDITEITFMPLGDLARVTVYINAACDLVEVFPPHMRFLKTIRRRHPKDQTFTFIARLSDEHVFQLQTLAATHQKLEIGFYMLSTVHWNTLCTV